MTKHVRIENADSGTKFKVLVQVFEKGYPVGEPDKLIVEERLDYPTAMSSPSVYLTSTRYIVVSEVALEDAR